MVRSDEVYLKDMQKSLLEHGYELGDGYELVGNYYDESGTTCEMCGRVVPINHVNVLSNSRTRRTLKVGRRCIMKYQQVLRELGMDGALLVDCRKSDMARPLVAQGMEVVEYDSVSGIRLPKGMTWEELSDLCAESCGRDDEDGDGTIPDEVDDEMDFDDEDGVQNWERRQSLEFGW